MKRIAIFPLILALLLCGCVGGRGEADDAEIIVGESSLYSREEILDAMEIAMKQFERGFECCEMRTMEYDEAVSAARGRDWAEQYGADEAIVLTSSFFVNGTKNPVLTAFHTYKNYQWILTRTGNGAWVLQTWGYG